jgi:hypothetical protein
MDLTVNQSNISFPETVTVDGLRCFVLQWTPILGDGMPWPIFWDVRVEENFEKHRVWVCGAISMRMWAQLRDSLGWDAQEVKERLRQHLLNRMPLGLGWDVQIIVADPPA